MDLQSLHLPRLNFAKLKLSKRRYVLMGIAAPLAALTAIATDVPAAPPDGITVPERTPIHVTLDQTLATNKNKAGDHFLATVSEPVVVDGNTVIPKGARVDGRVVDARKAGYLKGKADLRLAPPGCPRKRPIL